ncbi:MAG: IPT/TIG domain-containing protein [Bacteroidota bacterium]
MITKIHTLLKNALLLIITVSCGGPDAPLAKRDHPIVNTYHVADNMINELGASFQGAVLDLGTGVSDHGFYYGTLSIDASSALSSDVISLGPLDKVGLFDATATVDLVKGKLYYVRAFAKSATTDVIVFGQEMTFTARGSAAPTITDFNPKEGIAGDTVVITGTGFSSIAGNDAVWFDNAFAPITKASHGELKVVVPLSTTVGESNISVDVLGQKVTSTDKFTLLKMTITSYEPGGVGIADTVWFHGTNLPLVPSMSAGTIFQRTALTATSTRTLIGCVVGNDAATISSDLTIVVGSQSAHFVGPITLQAPVITSIDPIKGPPGTEVHIHGKNFNPDAVRNKVLFGTSQTEVVEASKHELTVKIPPFAGVGSSKNFSITLLDALTGQSAQAFTVTDH